MIEIQIEPFYVSPRMKILSQPAVTRLYSQSAEALLATITFFWMKPIHMRDIGYDNVPSATRWGLVPHPAIARDKQVGFYSGGVL